MEITTLLEYSERSQFRAWLQENHSKEKECWVVPAWLNDAGAEGLSYPGRDEIALGLRFLPPASSVVGVHHVA